MKVEGTPDGSSSPDAGTRNDDADAGQEQRSGALGAERAKAFIDAVVAIAMTLLILPLTESIGEIGSGDQGVSGWFVAHTDQLVSFLLSFTLIAMFWINHHRLFSSVDQVSSRLLWAMMGWLLSIVWLPAATAMSGQVGSKDPLVRVVYIGSMILIALFSLTVRLFLQQNSALHHIPREELRNGVAVDLAMITLFACALAISLIWPPLGYYPLFLMFLSGPTQAVFRRLLGMSKHE